MEPLGDLDRWLREAQVRFLRLGWVDSAGVLRTQAVSSARAAAMSAEGPARRLCATLLRSRRTLGERPRWGRSVSLRGKRPFIALHRACLLTTTGARQAHLDGFDLQANVAVAANNRDGLERLARYVLRPPIAQERLTRTADGHPVSDSV